MRQTALIVLTAIILTAVAAAQDKESSHRLNPGDYQLKTPDIVKRKCSDFFKTLIAGETEQAFQKILKDSPLEEKEDKVEELITQARRANNLYGRAMSYELVNSQSVASSLVRLRYMALHEKYPMRWIFTFYKSPKDGWIVVNILFDDMSEYFFTD